MQRIINYGSFLQAYALKRLLENEIHAKVIFIDYHFEKELISTNTKKRIFDKIKDNRTLINYIKKKIFLCNLKNFYIKDLKSIGINEKNFSKDIEALVIGSDEVFNCLQSFPVGYSRELFGYGFESIKVISYAASFGFTTLSELKENLIDKEISLMLSRFSALSVRDYNSYIVIKNLVKSEPLIHIDPVLAYDFKKEVCNYNINEHNYIILYSYTNRLSKEEERYIKNFAKKYNKKIFSVGNYSSIANKNICCNPLYIFSYFKNADFIITDTFHGTVFSIKTNAEFCTIIRKSNYNKLYYLLEKMDLKDRILTDMNDIHKLFQKKIDYTKANKIISEESQRTKEYLRSELRNGTN